MRISDWSSDVCSSDLLSDRYLLQSRPRRCIDETRRGHRDVALVSGDPPAFARPARLYSRDRKGSRDAADRTGGIGRPDSEIAPERRAYAGLRDDRNLGNFRAE